MNFIWFILIGALVGWLAGQIWKGSGFGMLGNIIVGILGGVIGGWLAPKLGIASDSLIGALLIALGGAIVLLLLINLVTGKR